MTIDTTYENLWCAIWLIIRQVIELLNSFESTSIHLRLHTPPLNPQIISDKEVFVAIVSKFEQEALDALKEQYTTLVEKDAFNSYLSDVLHNSILESRLAAGCTHLPHYRSLNCIERDNVKDEVMASRCIETAKKSLKAQRKLMHDAFEGFSTTSITSPRRSVRKSFKIKGSSGVSIISASWIGKLCTFHCDGWLASRIGATAWRWQANGGLYAEYPIIDSVNVQPNWIELLKLKWFIYNWIDVSSRT